jgi:hypothetical protein
MVCRKQVASTGVVLFQRLTAARCRTSCFNQCDRRAAAASIAGRWFFELMRRVLWEKPGLTKECKKKQKKKLSSGYRS